MQWRWPLHQGAIDAWEVSLSWVTSETDHPADQGSNGLALTYVTSLGPWPSGYSFSSGASSGKAFKLCRGFKICRVNHVRMFWFVFPGLTSQQHIHFEHLIQFSSHSEFSVHSCFPRGKSRSGYKTLEKISAHAEYEAFDPLPEQLCWYCHMHAGGRIRMRGSFDASGALKKV